MFDQALDTMGDLYASVIGTTVMQIKEIPRRPVEFDGVLCLFELKVDEATIKAKLKRFGNIKRVVLGTWPPAVVYFSTHTAAIAAKEAAAELSDLCGGVDTLYNTRPYDDRGWCCFEENVSSEVLSRLAVYPRLRDVLKSLPPKLLALRSDGEPEQVELAASDVGHRRTRVIEAIRKATFTGKGDKDKVIRLYEKYAEGILGKVQETLGKLQIDDAVAPSTIPMPTVRFEARQPLHLASSHIVLLRHQDTTQFGVVDASERKVVRTLAGGTVELAYDACVQEALPWTVPAHGLEEAMRRDVEALRGLGDRVRRLVGEVHPPYTEAGLKRLGDSTRAIVAASKSPSVASTRAIVEASKSPSVAEFAHDAGTAVHNALEAASKVIEDTQGVLDGDLDAFMGATLAMDVSGKSRADANADD